MTRYFHGSGRAGPWASFVVQARHAHYYAGQARLSWGHGQPVSVVQDSDPVTKYTEYIKFNRKTLLVHKTSHLTEKPYIHIKTEHKFNPLTN
jgi:hypothetical protein